MIDEIPNRLREPLFTDAPHAGAVIDSQYNIKAINKRWADLFGWSASESEVTSLMDLAERERDRKAIGDKIMLMIETSVPYDRINMIVRTKLGNLRKVLMQFMAVFDEARGGRFEFAIIWAQDLGAYEVANETAGRFFRLWTAIVITTVLLHFADFPELAKWLLSLVTGIGD